MTAPVMTAGPAVGPTVGQRLLERSVAYACASLDLVTQDDLTAPTPCRGWDVGALLGHLQDSVEALYEAAALGLVGLDGAPVDHHLQYGGPGDGVVPRLRARADTLLAAWRHCDDVALVSVGGVAVHPRTVAAAGALELTVHGWDVAVGCGRRRPLPEGLAQELLDVTTLVVGDDDRPWRFGPPVQVAGHASPGDRLLALLGRRP